MVESTLDPEWGVGPLGNEKPRMGVRGSLGGVAWGGWMMADWPTWMLVLGAGFGRRERRSEGRLRCRGGAVGPPDW